MRDPDIVTLGVLTAAFLATGWLVVYVRVLIPRQFEDRFRSSIQAFSTAVELRFPSHSGSTHRVVALSLAVGKRLGLNGRRLSDLEMAARLRDIGLCAIPYDLVNGRQMVSWSEAEIATYEQHPEVSGAMLELVPSLRRLAPIVRHHHADYAATLPLLNVPLESQILKVVTEYVWAERDTGALLAREGIRHGRGEAYAPEVVDAFLTVLTSGRVEDPAPVARV